MAMKKVYVPYDGMQMYYLDAYTDRDKAQDALEDYVRFQFSGSDNEDDWMYYLADECTILTFKVKT